MRSAFEIADEVAHVVAVGEVGDRREQTPAARSRTAWMRSSPDVDLERDELVAP